MVDTRAKKAEKIGRNEQCPCGSGKKYKKCCMAKDRAKTAGAKKEGLGAKVGKLVRGKKGAQDEDDE